MKHTIAALCCTVVLVASLAACGNGEDTSALPSHTGGSTPSTTVTSRPTTTAPTTTTTTAPTTTTTTTTATGPVALAAHSTYDYDGLTFVVNLPADIPAASRPSLRLFSDFLQGVGRTTARNRLDTSLSGQASTNVVKFVKAFVEAGSVRGIGTLTFTISNARTSSAGYTLITGCVDQSKLFQVRKDGSHFVAAAARKNRTLTMTADIKGRTTGLKVTRLEFTAGTC